MVWQLYILKCRDNTYYIGTSNNLERRLQEHRDGIGCDYTAKRLPIELLFIETFETENAAYNAEQQLKGWSRKKKEAYMKNDWTTIIQLSNKKSS